MKMKFMYVCIVDVNYLFWFSLQAIGTGTWRAAHSHASGESNGRANCRYVERRRCRCFLILEMLIILSFQVTVERLVEIWVGEDSNK